MHSFTVAFISTLSLGVHAASIGDSVSQLVTREQHNRLFHSPDYNAANLPAAESFERAGKLSPRQFSLGGILGGTLAFNGVTRPNIPVNAQTVVDTQAASNNQAAPNNAQAQAVAAINAQAQTANNAQAQAANNAQAQAANNAQAQAANNAQTQAAINAQAQVVNNAQTQAANNPPAQAVVNAQAQAANNPQAAITPQAAIDPQAAITPQAAINPQAAITPQAAIDSQAAITPQAAINSQAAANAQTAVNPVTPLIVVNNLQDPATLVAAPLNPADLTSNGPNIFGSIFGQSANVGSAGSINSGISSRNTGAQQDSQQDALKRQLPASLPVTLPSSITQAANNTGLAAREDNTEFFDDQVDSDSEDMDFSVHDSEADELEEGF